MMKQVIWIVAWAVLGPLVALFLGIDHTAIVVSDTEVSLKFYRNMLGMHIAGTSENHGIEQERLNNVVGARLRITTLRGSAGPGIELLEYLAPRDGRPRPPDIRANDIASWKTQIFIPELDDKVSLKGAQGSAAGSLISDPDGHTIERVKAKWLGQKRAHDRPRETALPSDAPGNRRR